MSRADSLAAYNASDKGKAARQRYLETDKGRSSRAAIYKRWAEKNPRKDDTAARLRRRAERLATEPDFKIAYLLRARMGAALKRKTKAGSAVRDLGCSVPDFMAYIESLWQPGMSWDNWPQVWQIDHIRPLAMFDLTDRDQFLFAAHYSNQQPLFTADHQEKSRQDNLRLRWFKSREDL